VEIQNTKEVGGLAVAVASDEANNGSGRFDEWKRQRLLGVGADVVIPDFRDAVRCWNGFSPHDAMNLPSAPLPPREDTSGTMRRSRNRRSAGL